VPITSEWRVIRKLNAQQPKKSLPRSDCKKTNRVLDHVGQAGELGTDDWDEWSRQVLDEIGDRLGLLVSEKIPSQSLCQRLSSVSGDVFVRYVPAGLFVVSGALVLVVLEPNTSDEVALGRLGVARETRVGRAMEQESPVVPHE
jgi:hypothetical protein